MKVKPHVTQSSSKIVRLTSHRGVSFSIPPVAFRGDNFLVIPVDYRLKGSVESLPELTLLFLLVHKVDKNNPPSPVGVTLDQVFCVKP